MQHAAADDFEAQIREWDARYAESDKTWSGNPNEALVAELSGRPPGRALDVGCGEGADAIWLGRRGWEATGIDVSGVALDRARRAAEAAEVAVTWRRLRLAEAYELGTFDAVSACYAPLLKTPHREAERALLAAVAPGGVLVWIHHTDIDRDRAHEHGFDPDDYVGEADILAALDDGWFIETRQRRPRHVAEGAGAHHHEDVVVTVRRTDTAETGSA